MTPTKVQPTRAEQDFQGMMVFVLDEAVQSGLRVRPPIRIWEVEWDGGVAEMITTDHTIKISSKNSHVETKIPHGDPKDPEWRFLTKARVEDAVSTRASQTT